MRHVRSPEGPSASLDASHSTQNGEPPLASVYLATNVGTDPSGGGSTATCNIAPPLAPFFTIGTMEAPVANGQAAVTLDCVVHPEGDGFDVNIQVTQGGADSFSFNTTKPITDTAGPESGVAMSVGKTPDTYSDATDCTFTLSNEGSPAISGARSSARRRRTPKPMPRATRRRRSSSRTAPSDRARTLTLPAARP